MSSFKKLVIVFFIASSFDACLIVFESVISFTGEIRLDAAHDIPRATFNILTDKKLIPLTTPPACPIALKAIIAAKVENITTPRATLGIAVATEYAAEPQLRPCVDGNFL